MIAKHKAQRIINGVVDKVDDALHEVYTFDLTIVDRMTLDAAEKHLISTVRDCVKNVRAAASKERMKYHAGQALQILPHDETPKKPIYWKVVVRPDGARRWELKLLRRCTILSPWTKRSWPSWKAIKDDDGRIVTFPPGTIGYVVNDITPKKRLHSKKIHVRFGGWDGFCEVNNFKIYEHV